MNITNGVILIIGVYITSACKPGGKKSKALEELYSDVEPRRNYTGCCKDLTDKIERNMMEGCNKQCANCIIDKRDRTVMTDI